ncbi:hypothetical protein MTR_4g065020 [Medicago truncatula]|uniref:Uncharacterized protein n=1 Tax=Medicago truncatula TaxID=3880 RepID=A0A072UMA3_MEDTR|nr:hypothetical protein MTR_4g065020 [Medicago truncatula]
MDRVRPYIRMPPTLYAHTPASSHSTSAKYKWLEHDEDKIKKSFNSRGSLALKNALFKKVEMKREPTCFELYDRPHRPK